MKPKHLGKMIFLFGFFALCAMVLASSALAAAPTGASPDDPLMVPTGGQSISGSSTLWFYFDYASKELPRGRGRSPRGHPGVQIALDANGVSELAFGVYTPDQAKNWVSDPTTAPAGRGTPYTDTAYDTIKYDLYWAGGFNTSGRYLIAVTNNNSNPVSFRMTVTGDTVQLYPVPTPEPTATLPVPFTPAPVVTGTISGKVVFETATGGEIWTVNGDGSDLKLITHGIDPSWSPDGKQIIFARWDNTNPGLFIANADGSNERLVFGAPKIRWPRMSPDGKYIVFSQDKSKSDRDVIWKLGLVDVATGKLTEPQCSQLCYVPSWGPDSATLVYTDPNIGVMTTNAFSGPEKLLGPTGSYWDAAANISRPIVHWPPIQDSELSPDGSLIVYSMQAADRWELNRMYADGGGVSGITTPDPVLYYLMNVAVHNVSPIWSPDGKQILYLSDRTGKWGFFVTDPNGQNVKQVLKNVTDQITLTFGYNNERMMDWTK